MDKEYLDQLFDIINGSFPVALKPRYAKSHFSGDWESPYTGEGVDVVGLREFIPGEDDPKRIDFGTSKKSQKLMVVDMEERREDRVLVVLDVSSSMSSEFSREKMHAAYSAAVMIFTSALRQRIHCGVFIAGKFQTAEFFPALGDKHLYRIKEALSVSICEGIGSVEGPKRDRSGNLALRAWRKVLPRGSVVFLVSDFLGNDGGNLFSLLEESAYGYRVVPLVVQDELEYSFPTDLPRGSISVGALEVETGNAELVSINRKQAQRIKLKHEQRFSRLKRVFSDRELLWAHISSMDLDEIQDTIWEVLFRITRR